MVSPKIETAAEWKPLFIIMGKNNIASKSNWFERNISATHLFAAGLLSFPTFIFQKILYIKVLQTF